MKAIKYALLGLLISIFSIVRVLFLRVGFCRRQRRCRDQKDGSTIGGYRNFDCKTSGPAKET